jgi:type 1 fimbriae regulatory protein FimB
MQYLGINQVTDILRTAFKSSRRDHLLLLLSFSHGLRRSEVARLTLGDVQDGRICVSRVKGSLRTEQPLMPSKNVLFDEPKALAAWLEERRSKTDYLFPSRFDNGHMNVEAAGKAAARVMRDAGMPIELAHHHSLRHACGALTVRNGVTVEYVSQWLGHKDVKNTINYYLHISGDEAADKIKTAMSSLF